MYQDQYGLSLSCCSDEAGEAYVTGIDDALRLDRPGIEPLRRAISLDPDFALGHAALARQLQIHGFSGEVHDHLQRAVKLKPGATPRERASIDVVVSAATFQPDALALAGAHIKAFPNDVFVLAHVLGPFGLLAFSGQRDWREKNVELIDSLRGSFPEDDWWFTSSLAFLAAEVGDLAAARQYAEHAWSLDENGNTAHSIAHLHFEEGELQQGKRFIREWIANHGHASDMRHHLVWHLALLQREEGADASEMLEIFARELDPKINDPMPLSTFSDNASLLWRCQLSGLQVPADAIAELVAYGERHYPNTGFVFADVHRVMAAGLAGEEQQDELLASLVRRTIETGSRECAVMQSIAEGFFAFAKGDFHAASNLLQPVLADSVLLGGSNPQRRIVAETCSAATSAAA